MNLLIDSIFVVDLLLKLRAQGMTYVRTPWFLIDLLSCLPLLDVLANSIPGVRAARFARGFRILRILRGLRVLRALRTIPAFDEFFDEAPRRREHEEVPPRDERRDDRADRDGPGHHRGGPEADHAASSCGGSTPGSRAP